MKQPERILWHLEKRGPIDCKIAAVEYGIMALHSRISDLRKQGYKFKMTWKSGTNRYGEPCRWPEYELLHD